MVIHCNTLDRITRHRFRVLKLDLKEKGYPYEDTKKFVETYFNFSLNKYDKLFLSNHNVEHFTCISPPSSSGFNPIPNIFFELLYNRYKSYLSLNYLETNDFFNPVFADEAKHNTNFHKKINLPITISEKNKGSLLKFKSNIDDKSNIILLEDWMSTGDTSILFSKYLMNNGININNYAALVVNTPSFISNTDIRKEIEKFKKYSSNIKDLCYTFSILFDGFLKNKLYRFQLEIYRSPIKNQKFITNYLDNVMKSGALNYTQSRLFDIDKVNEKADNLYKLIKYRELKYDI